MMALLLKHNISSPYTPEVMQTYATDGSGQQIDKGEQ